MVHVIGDLGFSAIVDKNISGTCRTQIQDRDARVNLSGRDVSVSAPGTCSFVVADWRLGDEPFCGGPTRPGSSYCARHQALCVVPRGSAESRSREAALAVDVEAAPEPPPELAHLKESALPEPFPDDIGDLRAFLDHPPPDPAVPGSE